MKPEKLDPINLFVTGGAGAGKSHLMKAIYHAVVETFRYGTINPERPTVAVMAPTGVAAININRELKMRTFSTRRRRKDQLGLGRV